MIDYDMMLVHVGEFGRYQKALFIFQGPFCMFISFLLFGQIFIYLYPRIYWCEEHPCLNFTSMTREQRRNLSIPFLDEDFDPCFTYNVSVGQIRDVIVGARDSCQTNQACNDRSTICRYLIQDGQGTCIPVNDGGDSTMVERQRRQFYGNRAQFNPYGSYGPQSPQVFFPSSRPRYPVFPTGTDDTTTFSSVKPRPQQGRPGQSQPSGSDDGFRFPGSPGGGNPTRDPSGWNQGGGGGPSSGGRFPPDEFGGGQGSSGGRVPSGGAPGSSGGRVPPGAAGPGSSGGRVPPGAAGPGTSGGPNTLPSRETPGLGLLTQNPKWRDLTSCSQFRNELQDLFVTIDGNFTILPNNTWIDGENLTRNAGGRGNLRRWELTECTNWTWDRNGEIWDYPTIVAEENWWCDPGNRDSFLAGILGQGPAVRIFVANTMFYIGAIVGGVGIGYIADGFGRVPALVAANVIGFFGGILSALFYSNFFVFCFFRFISGMSFDNSFTMIYILVLEYVGPTYRTIVANLSIAIFYTLGQVMIPWVALWIKNWRTFMIVLSVPQLLGLVAIFLVPESARWLLSKGRTREATNYLRRFAKINGREVDESIFIEFEEGAKEVYEQIKNEKPASLGDIFKKPRLAKNFIFLTIIWSLIALCYDGHSRNILNLGENVFLLFTVACATELPADLLLIVLLDRLGRRWLAFFSLFLSGIFSLIAAFVPADSTELALVTALLSRFCVNVAVNIGLQFAAELLPTVVRAQGVNTIHIMGYVASIVSPFIAAIGRSNPALALTFLGICAVVAGICCLFLPETLGEDLPNTLDEGNNFGVNQSFWNCPICAKPKVIPEDQIGLEVPPTPVQLRNSLMPSLRGETMRSSIISQSSSSGRPGSRYSSTELTRLRRVYTR